MERCKVFELFVVGFENDVVNLSDVVELSLLNEDVVEVVGV